MKNGRYVKDDETFRDIQWFSSSMMYIPGYEMMTPQCYITCAYCGTQYKSDTDRIKCESCGAPLKRKIEDNKSIFPNSTGISAFTMNIRH